MAPDGPAPVDVVLTASAAAPPSVVWRALVDPVIRSGWWPDTDLDPTAGGPFEERWPDPSGEPKPTAGRVEAASRSRSLRLRWADTDWPAQTTVTIDLVPVAAAPRSGCGTRASSRSRTLSAWRTTTAPAGRPT